MVVFCFGFPVVLFGGPGVSDCHAMRCICPRLCFFMVLERDLFVYPDHLLALWALLCAQGGQLVVCVASEAGGEVGAVGACLDPQ